MTTQEQTKGGKCDSCEQPLSNEYLCRGCDRYVCDDCSVNYNIGMGRHNVDDHYIDPDEEEEDEAE